MQGSDNGGALAPHNRSRDAALKNKRTAAKIGMAVSLGVSVTTGLMDTSRARAWHLCSGIALVGFSAWHYTLYPNTSRRPGR